VLADNGNKIGQTTTGANGFYYFIMPYDTILPASNDLVFVTGDASVKANHVSYVNASEQVTGFDLVDGLLQVSRSDATNPLLPTEALGTALGSLSGYSSDIFYSVSGGNVTLNSDKLFKAGSATGMRIDGSVTVNGSHVLGLFSDGPVTQNTAITASWLDLQGNG
jgi:hypothetical protein